MDFYHHPTIPFFVLHVATEWLGRDGNGIANPIFIRFIWDQRLLKSHCVQLVHSHQSSAETMRPASLHQSFGECTRVDEIHQLFVWLISSPNLSVVSHTLW